ncbi:MAG: HlyD family secretion protein, partial [Gammaproteobacteria bacterium]
RFVSRITRHSLALAEAGVRTLQVSLERLTVRAPRAGLLDSLPFKHGEQPPVGAVIAVLLAGDTPYARVYLPEQLHARVAINSRAQVFVDGIAQPFTGHVRRLSRDAVFTPFYTLTERDRSRLSYLAEVQLEGEAAAQLPSGTPLRVEFTGPGNAAP